MRLSIYVLVLMFFSIDLFYSKFSWDNDKKRGFLVETLGKNDKKYLITLKKKGIST